MAAYLIVDVDLKDPEGYKPYLAATPAIVRKHGGEFLVRGGSLDVIEGEWQPTRIVLLRFPDRAAAQGFIDDPEYQPLKEIRHRVARTDMVLVEGA